MATNADNFSRRVRFHGKQIPEEGIVEIHRWAHIEAGRRLILRSPVGNPSLWKNPPPKGYAGGTFRDNWQTGIGSAPLGERVSADPVAEGAAKVANLSPFVLTIWINNLPYAQRLEDGWSTQAPRGLVRITSAEIAAAIGGSVGAGPRTTAQRARSVAPADSGLEAVLRAGREAERAARERGADDGPVTAGTFYR